MSSLPITRFAPSPTGILHIGNARTALFNWLYARHTGGQFLLRIEDTDRARSTQPAIDAIFTGLQLLGIDWDGEAVFQSTRLERHQQAAAQLLAQGRAYKAYGSAEQIDALRQSARDANTQPNYASILPSGSNDDYVVRLQMPRNAQHTLIHDLIQGDVSIANSELDDMVLLRSDGTPTYMLAAVVDDIDMNVSHVIRGDDHLINAARQSHLFMALDAAVPTYAHMPLIHGDDGRKLSKRHGDLGVADYVNNGYLPYALRNYLAKLGWGGIADDIFTIEQAIAAFNVADVGRAPSRLDFNKLNHINAHYLRQMTGEQLANLLGGTWPTSSHALLHALCQRVHTTVELRDAAAFVQAPVAATPAAADLLAQPHNIALLQAFSACLQPQDTAAAYDALIKEFLTAQGIKMPAFGPVLRAALCGRTDAPALGLIIEALGVPQVHARVAAVQ